MKLAIREERDFPGRTLGSGAPFFSSSGQELVSAAFHSATSPMRSVPGLAFAVAVTQFIGYIVEVAFDGKTPSNTNANWRLGECKESAY